ncbi:TonB-dependent receptor [Polaribacter sargassicola]|uniref:TonB-dependent receptor n=1 Tax=Polaribacter sargassicola TaxID=2836891 RepID=UPI001F2ED27F|nr:TonB-dependent receptor [Polaribacter sp. DS7-9]MCG1036706.1 TonB-dependent receptor [Polaribacter sp. DS7-9]
MIKLLCKYVFAICITTTAFTQECQFSFKGKITDFHDNTSIIGASLQIENSNKFATTDFDGLFEFKNLCEGKYTIVIKHISCETKRVTVSVNKNTFQEITLEHHVEDLKEVIVTSTHNVTAKTNQTTKIDSKTIDEFSGKSLGDALKNVAGVSSINTGNTIVKPVINGLHSSRIIVMTDGVRLQDQEWGIEHAPNIDINNADKITVVKGANSLEFGGDAIGGVIVLEPSKYVLKDSIFGKTILGIQSNGRGGNLHSSITKTTKKGWFLNAKTTLKRFGDFNSPDYNLTNTGLASKAFSIHTGLKKFENGFTVDYSFINNNIGILKASHIGNIDDLVSAINNKEPLIVESFSYDINAPKQEINHHIFKIDYYKRFQDLGKLDIQYDFQKNQRYEYDIRVGDDKDKASIDLDLTTHSISSTFDFNNNLEKTYKIGVKGVYQNNFANPLTGVRRLIPDYDKFDAGIFAIGNYILNDKTTANVGLRYDFNYINAKKFYLKSRWTERGYDEEYGNLITGDYTTQWLVNPKFSFHNISASAGIVYQINDKNAILFNYGLSNRSPNASELFSDGLHHSAARIELGDLALQQEISNRISSTYNFTSNNTFISVETFFNNIHNFIYLEPTGTEQTIRGAFPVWEYKATNANLFGFDFTWRQKINNALLFSNKSSLTFGNDVKNNKSLIDIPAPSFKNSLEYKNVNWHQLSVRLDSELVLKQTNYPNNNFTTYLPTKDSYEVVDISSTPAGYHLLHLHTDAVFHLSKKTDLQISASVTNLLNTKYRDYLNRLRYYADDLGRNYNLQIKINY